MQSSLEFYLTPLVTKLGILPDVESKQWGSYEEVSSLHLFQLHVQRLFDYGMQLCIDRDMVTESLVVAYSQNRDRNYSRNPKKTVRLSLFKTFRKDLVEHMLFARTSNFSFDRPNEPGHADAHDELTPAQREAIFLKLRCEFSYQEVADIMNIRIKSAYTLVRQAMEKNVSQKRGQTE